MSADEFRRFWRLCPDEPGAIEIAPDLLDFPPYRALSLEQRGELHLSWMIEAATEEIASEWLAGRWP